MNVIKLYCATLLTGVPNQLFYKCGNQGAQIPLTCTPPGKDFGRKPYSLICGLDEAEILFFFLTAHHFVYYLTLAKNIGAWNRNMNHCLCERFLLHFSVFNIAAKLALANKSICHFAIATHWHLYWEKNIFAFTLATKNQFAVIKIYSQ